MRPSLFLEPSIPNLLPQCSILTVEKSETAAPALRR